MKVQTRLILKKLFIIKWMFEKLSFENWLMKVFKIYKISKARYFLLKTSFFRKNQLSDIKFMGFQTNFLHFWKYYFIINVWEYLIWKLLNESNWNLYHFKNKIFYFRNFFVFENRLSGYEIIEIEANFYHILKKFIILQSMFNTFSFEGWFIELFYFYTPTKTKLPL